MKAVLMILVLAGTLLCPAPTPADEAPAERFEDVKAKATQMGDSEVGKEYQKRSEAALYTSAEEAIKECSKDRYATGVVNLVLVVSADGTIERVLQASDQPMSAYLAKKFTGLQLPAPPRAAWLLSVKLNMM